jgi:hypothetical protein
MWPFAAVAAFSLMVSVLQGSAADTAAFLQSDFAKKALGKHCFRGPFYNICNN